MFKVVLLKKYKDVGIGEIIEVSTNEGFGLIDTGFARKAETRDFLIKPSFENSQAKAFGQPINSTKGRLSKIRKK